MLTCTRVNGFVCGEEEREKVRHSLCMDPFFVSRCHENSVMGAIRMDWRNKEPSFRISCQRLDASSNSQTALENVQEQPSFTSTEPLMCFMEDMLQFSKSVPSPKQSRNGVLGSQIIGGFSFGGYPYGRRRYETKRTSTTDHEPSRTKLERSFLQICG